MAAILSLTSKAILLLAAIGLLAAQAQTDGRRVLDDFESLTPWTVQHTDDVSASIAAADGKTGKALRLDFDFNGVNGYATVHRELPLQLPPNYEITFWIRGEAPINNLQFKLIDASGENVWWLNQPDYTFPHEWTQVRIKKRQLAFAWGPSKDRDLKRSASIEFVVSSGRDGGKGSIYFDELTLRELPVPPLRYPQPRASASSTQRGTSADLFSESSNDLWCSDPQSGHEQTYDIDLQVTREFGGLVIDWWGKPATDYDISLGDDAHTWRRVRSVHDADGGSDALDLPESEARYIRIAMHRGSADSYCLTGVTVKDLAWGATPNAFFEALAKDAGRGTYPRGFTEQVYWTVVGVDGGPTPALMSEDGAIQPGKTSYSIEPFLLGGGKLTSWANVTLQQSLLDDYLPIPRVEWKSGNMELETTAFATGTRIRSQVVVRYRLRNRGDTALTTDLVLAIRPFQVNPPMQFLNAPGGFSPIREIAWDSDAVRVNGSIAVSPLQAPTRFVASTFDAGQLPERLLQETQPAATSAHDERGYASGALIYHLDVPAHGEREVALLAPLAGAMQLPPRNQPAPAWVEQELNASAVAWRERLNRVALTLPQPRIANTLRTALAHILISRDGPALRPGTRAYARAWIRDGAMIADALLRLGETGAVRDFVDWYAPHQFANGKVPCCVDQRGSDPVPENDSHGELIHLIAQTYRYTEDRGELEKLWPRIEAAVAYMDSLRASETGAADPAFKGLLPASISHEGYSARPEHSYWDDFWALAGYKDAAAIAQQLGKPDTLRLAQARDAFSEDLTASIAAATKQHGIEFLPGCAELGDFDATSTTIALAPADARSKLPDTLLHNTFERYWNEFVARRDGAKPWDDYTPYEWRTVGAFVRLGWRARAQELIDFFFTSGVRPPAWNQWAEVVGHDARKPRFVGDLPHGWVASDFIRSALDLFAYERDGALVLAGGVPGTWLDGHGIAIERLRTAYGPLTYRLRRDGDHIELRIEGAIKPPNGFVFPWPLAGTPGATRINAAPAEWRDNELHIRSAPATVTIEQ